MTQLLSENLEGENLHSSWLVAQPRVSFWRGCFGAGF